MKKFAKLVVFLLVLVCANLFAVAEGIDGLWGGLTQSIDGSIIYTDGDQWGLYFEDDVCYEAYFLNGEWFYVGEKPIGLVKVAYNDSNVYKTSDRRFTFTLKGEKIFVEFERQGSVHLITFSVKKISSIKPKEITLSALQKKFEKYNKTK